jgi:hypothetical protein
MLIDWTYDQFTLIFISRNDAYMDDIDQDPCKSIEENFVQHKIRIDHEELVLFYIHYDNTKDILIKMNALLFA